MKPKRYHVTGLSDAGTFGRTPRHYHYEHNNLTFARRIYEEALTNTDPALYDIVLYERILPDQSGCNPNAYRTLRRQTPTTFAWFEHALAARNLTPWIMQPYTRIHFENPITHEAINGLVFAANATWAKLLFNPETIQRIQPEPQAQQPPTDITLAKLVSEGWQSNIEHPEYPQWVVDAYKLASTLYNEHKSKQLIRKLPAGERANLLLAELEDLKAEISSTCTGCTCHLGHPPCGHCVEGHEDLGITCN